MENLWLDGKADRLDFVDGICIGPKNGASGTP